MNLNRSLVIVCSEFPPLPGGIGNHAWHLARQFAAHGYTVTVITDSRSAESAQLEETRFDSAQPFRIDRTPAYRFRIFVSLVRTYRILRYLLLSENQTVIASGRFPLWIVAFSILFGKQHRLYAVVHGTELLLGNGIQRLFTRLALHAYRQLIPVSKYTEGKIKALNANLRTLVINNGFESAAASLLVKEKPGPLKLVTIGSMTPRKGQQNVIRALPLLINHFPGITYHIAGIPQDKTSLLALATSLGVEQQVVFHDVISEEQKVTLLNDSHIFMMLSALTSTGDFEGFGIAILEANHFGVPAIGSRNSGIADAIDEGRSGFLVNEGDPESVLSATKQLMANYTFYATQAQRWSARFSWDLIIQQYLNLLSDEQA